MATLAVTLVWSLLLLRPGTASIRLKAFVGGSNGDNRRGINIVIGDNIVYCTPKATQPGIIAAGGTGIFIGSRSDVSADDIYAIGKGGFAGGDL